MKDRRMIWVAGLLLLQAVLSVISFEMVVRGNLAAVGTWMVQQPVYTIYNIAIFAVFLWLFYLLFHDLRWNFLVWQVIVTIFGVAEALKLASRKEYVEVADLTIAGEWTQAASDVTFTQYGLLVGVAVVTLAVLIGYSLLRRFWKSKRTRRQLRNGFALFGGVLAAFVLFVYVPVVHTGIKERVVLGMQGERKGAMVCFVESLAYQMMDDSYSDEIYEEVLASAGLSETDLKAVSACADTLATKPNIIVMMSEALWDINQLGEAVSFSQNPMEAFDALGSTSFQGKAASNVFGGGTDKSEFEFLTGWNAKYAVNGSSPYRDYFTHGQASIVQYLKGLGYDTYGIHPYKGSFWGRTDAYANMGFDQFYDMEQMMYRDQYDIFISDQSLVNEIIYRFEKQRVESDAPVFSFSVSLANHVTKFFEGTAGPVCRDIQVDYLCDASAISDYNQRKLREYVNGVYTSGKAVQALISYFEKLDEPTVILIFGDHAPSFLSEFEPFVSETVSQEGFYETPFYVWNNFGKTGFTTEEANISYLSGALLEYLDFPLSKQALMNRYLRSYCPVDTRFLVKEASGAQQNIRQDDYISRSYGVSSAMHYLLPKASDTESDIWTAVTQMKN